jgi:DNA-directed RNA polymerase subunit RPC12/RpoP
MVLIHLFSATAAWMGTSAVSFVCTECGAHSESAIDDIIERHGQDCTVGQVVAAASCARCGSPFIMATPAEEDDE